MDNKKPKGLEEKMKEENEIAGGKISAVHTTNAGLLLRDKSDAFLIDSLYPKEEAPPRFAFHFPDAKTIDFMLKGLPPFDGLSAYVFTHFHPDHGDTAVISQIADKTVPVVAPYTGYVPRIENVAEKLEGLENRTILLREPIERHRIGNTALIAVRTEHDGGENYKIEHYSYLFEFHEGTVFFSGDVLTTDPALTSFLSEYTKSRKIDAAFINYPELSRTSGRALITNIIRPDILYLTHFPAGEDGAVKHHRLTLQNIERYKDILPEKIYLQNKPFTV